jgi:hypothetical protein
MTDSYMREAYRQVCNKAKEAKAIYVSLYAQIPFYGGPEEGGWWGHDTVLESYQEVATVEMAEALKVMVEALAEEMNVMSKRQHGERCLQELEWLEARGLDPDFLPEVDGETHYFVVIENIPGSHVHKDSRQYS